MNLETICRVCANDLALQNDVFNFETVANIYYSMTCLQISEVTLSEKICRNCYDMLRLFENFRLMCIKAYDQLKKIQSENIKIIESSVSRDVSIRNPDNRRFEEIGAHAATTESSNESDNESIEPGDKHIQHYSDLSNLASTSKEKVLRKINCKQCGKFFYNEKRHDAHVREHQGLKPATCNVCHKEFAKFTYLKVHMELVHAEVKKRIVCDVEGCDLSFATLHGMITHKDSKHLGKQITKRRHICEYCGKVFTNATLLNYHRDKHNGIQRHTCPTCGKAHTSRHKLKLHLLTHAGIKQFQCSICGVKTVTSNQLKVHMNRHTKEKQYKCHLCESVFNSSSNKSRHVKLVHHGVRKFKCSYCDRAFGKVETLKNHTMIHTGEKPHGCNICGKRFIQLIAMQKHLKIHNKCST